MQRPILTPYDTIYYTRKGWASLHKLHELFASKQNQGLWAAGFTASELLGENETYQATCWGLALSRKLIETADALHKIKTDFTIWKQRISRVESPTNEQQANSLQLLAMRCYDIAAATLDLLEDFVLFAMHLSLLIEFAKSSKEKNQSEQWALLHLKWIAKRFSEEETPIYDLIAKQRKKLETAGLKGDIGGILQNFQENEHMIRKVAFSTNLALEKMHRLGKAGHSSCQKFFS